MLESFSHLLEMTGTSTGFRPDYLYLSSTLKSCATLSNVKLGRVLHSHIVKLGHVSCQLVGKALLNMYAKCNALDDTQKLFSQIQHFDSVNWNIILSGYSRSGSHDKRVMNSFQQMYIGQDPKPNSVTIAIILPVCVRLGDLNAGKRIHAYTVKSGLEFHTLTGNSLLSMYAKSGNAIKNAYQVFDRIPEKDVVSWNAMIAGFSENNHSKDAFTLFCKMVKGIIPPNYATIANILPVCSSYRIGKEIHCFVLQREELSTNIFVSNALVSFYLRIGQLQDAEKLFKGMIVKDLVTWNAIISGYTSNGEWMRALELFREFLSMETVGPDSVTILSVLPLYTHLHNLKGCKQIHGYVIKHPLLSKDTSVWNSLISFYAKCGDIESSFLTFSLMHRKDLISWNSMLDAFADSRFQARFFDLLNKMHKERVSPDSLTLLAIVQFCSTVLDFRMIKQAHGFIIRHNLLLLNSEPTLGNAVIDAYTRHGNMDYALKVFEVVKRNVVTYNSIISGYMMCGFYDEAHRVFDSMPEKDITSWNLMIRLYSESGCHDKAISLLRGIIKGDEMFEPDSLTVMSLLPLCSQMASVHLLRQCHGYVVRACFTVPYLIAAMLDVYSKCGSIDYAYKLFKSTNMKDLVIFTAMIGGYAMNGMAKDAVTIFNEMLELGLKPDHVLLTTVLSACSHVGLVDEGLKIFSSIEKIHRIKPSMEQYACVVDLLARGGRISDAYEFVCKMPIEPNANIWGTLLGGCKTHNEFEIGRVVADRLLASETKDVGNYVVMSNLYAADAKWDGVLEMRKLMKNRDMRKPAGCSWIEVEKSKNTFLAGDTSHPKRIDIYDMLSMLDRQMKERFDNYESAKTGLVFEA